YRWIRLPGFQLQPSEFMKVAYLMALAWYLRYRKNYRRVGGLIWPFLISVVPLTLILLEPDLGTVLLLVPVLFSMLLLAGAKIQHLLMIAMIGLAAAPFCWEAIKPYQQLRVSAVLMQSESVRRAIIESPERYKFLATKREAIEWAASSGLQLVHSKNAIGSGGLLGYGWGNGTYVQHGRLPDRHNDFIMAVIGQQWGFAGCVLVLGCYAVIVIAGVRVASVTADPFARLLAVGVVVMITTQVIINVGMSVGLMPITGMSLPFVSYGGSGLFTNFIALGLLISVSQRRPFLLANKPFEYRRRRPESSELHGYEEGLPALTGSSEDSSNSCAASAVDR
ncbi:MAG: rod shape-determining protein RodA, partial [Planctomycetes bacterium]|nr:rod shape-determining protein RodA [Planctomycetota bacterium]